MCFPSARRVGFPVPGVELVGLTSSGKARAAVLQEQSVRVRGHLLYGQSVGLFSSAPGYGVIIVIVGVIPDDESSPEIGQTEGRTGHAAVQVSQHGIQFRVLLHGQRAAVAETVSVGRDFPTLPAHICTTPSGTVSSCAI